MLKKTIDKLQVPPSLNSELWNNNRIRNYINFCFTNQALQAKAEETDKLWMDLNPNFPAQHLEKEQARWVRWQGFYKPVNKNNVFLLHFCIGVCVCVGSCRWLEVKQDLIQTSERLNIRLQAWKLYSDLYDSCSEKLKLEKDEFSKVLKLASEHNDDTKRLTICIQNLHVSTGLCVWT